MEAGGASLGAPVQWECVNCPQMMADTRYQMEASSPVHANWVGPPGRTFFGEGGLGVSVHA